MVAALDALRELDLLRAPSGAARVRCPSGKPGARLSRLLAPPERVRGLLGRCLIEDLDLQLVERRVEVLDLGDVEVELVQRQRHLIVRQETGLLALLDECLRFLVLDDVTVATAPSLPRPAPTETPS